MDLAYWRNNLAAYLLILLGLIVPALLSGSSAILAQSPPFFVGQVRALDPDDVGIRNPAGLAYATEAEAFYVVQARRPDEPPTTHTDVIKITHVGDRAGSVRIAAAIQDPVNVAFDDKFNRLLIYQPASGELIEVLEGPAGNLDPSTLTRHDVRHFGLEKPQGMTVDPVSGDVFFLDSAGLRIVRVKPAPDGRFENAGVSEIKLDQIDSIADVRGIAFDSSLGHFHVFDPVKQKLHEITGAGQFVATRDLSEFGLGYSGGMVFAPSGDLTDDPGQTSLYFADGGLSVPRRLGKIVELTFTQPAAMQATATASLVQTIDTSQFSPPSPDAAGVAYLEHSNTLLESDSEVEEVPAIFTGDNLFEITLSGVLTDTYSTISYSDEPTGITYNPANRHLFISDDDADRVFEVDPGPDELYDTSDDVVTSFDTRAFGSHDAEGVAFAGGSPDSLFVVDGANKEVYHITPGANGVFDGVSPDGDDQMTHFDTDSLGVGDPEGITYVTDHDTLYLVGSPTDELAEVTTTGTLVRTIDISAANSVNAAGLAYAPGSLDPNVWNVYVADRGIDSDSNTNPGDGKIYEMSIPPLNPGNQAPSADAGPDQTLTLPGSAALDGTVSDDGQPDPPGSVTTTWSQVSGSGTVTFTNASAVDTMANISVAGTYVLRLTADDGDLIASDDLTICPDLATLQSGAGLWQTQVGDPNFDPAYDVNGDGKIDILDLAILAAGLGLCS